MPAKLMQCTNLQLVIILTVVVLVSRPCALSTTPGMNVADSPSVQQMTGVELNDTQDERYPMVRLLATTNEAEVSDERGLNLGSTVTKLKDMTTSGTQILKTFVTSNPQLQTDKLYKKFKVGTGEVNLFKSPQFHNWFNSVSKLYKKNVEKGELAMVTTLVTQYGDDVIPKLLIEANRASSTNIIARKLEEDQFTKWSADKMNVGSVFNLLKFDKTGDDLFKSPLLSTWVKYAYKIEKQPEETLFFALRSRFDDNILAKMLIAAKKDSSVAVNLEKVELEEWLRRGKSSDEAYKLLSLNDETKNVLKNPAFTTWVSYVMKVDKNSPYDVAIAKLLASYDDQRLVKMIYSAKQNSKMIRLAENLQMAQEKVWARDGKSPSDIFKLLSLQMEDGITLLKNDMLRVWISYVKRLQINPYELLLKELKIRSKNEGDLARMLSMAKIDYRSYLAAQPLERLLQNNWIGEGKTAEDVFKLLKLEREGESMFSSPMWNSWNSYLNGLIKGDPDEMIYLVLRSQLGEVKLEKLIGKAKENVRTKNIADKLQEEAWRSGGKSADDIFILLKLDEKKEKLFESPMFSTWISYVTNLDKLKVKSNEFAVVSYLEKKFGDLNLARIIVTGKKENNDVTKKVVTDLQRTQFKQWMDGKSMDPKVLNGMLMRDTSNNANLQLALDFNDFYKANGGSPFYRT